MAFYPRRRGVPQTQTTMTEKQVKVFQVKLKRIWRVVAPFRVKPSYGGFDLRAPVSQDVELRVSAGSIGLRNHALYALALHKIGPNLSFLSCVTFQAPQTLLGDYRTESPEDIRQWQNEYMDFFRRSCWLSGCSIEASAHEKMEWIQGFSREEIEAWNLKM
ncbi:hypothetical protein IAD21_00249 [Abditibacteriota bacterium]|nr:hypothetical protein IAD21_00249 [Abditibacteriota bacterium]